MRSLVLKLTLAFLIVGLTGAVLVAVFVGLRTQRNFNQFVSDRFQADLVTELGDYYTQHGSWEDIGTILVRNPYQRPGQAEFVPAPVTLLNDQGVVVKAGRRYQLGEQVPARVSNQGLPIVVHGRTVGTVLIDGLTSRTYPAPNSPEADFLARLNQAIVLGALAATGIALLLGILLARTISRPVRELTVATQVVAQGELGHQVPVRTKDELGELATSFNQMSADLAHASELRRQMTADIAHELRTPLSVILGYTEALSDGKLLGSPEMYDAMHGEAKLLSHLIDDLRTLSLADAGELSLARQICAPAALLERTAASHATLALQKGIDLSLDVAPELPAIRVDPERMAQVLGNLVTNALRFTPDGGLITITVTPKSKEVQIDIQDNGVGIPEEFLEKIFQGFFQVEDHMTRTYGGMGIGLNIARGILQLHEGRVWAESDGPDQGAKISVVLPRA